MSIDERDVYLLNHMNGQAYEAELGTEMLALQTATGALTGLADGAIYIGDVAGAVAEKTISGDITMTREGVVTIANSAVETAMIADSNVTTAKIADSNVTTAKIADANVTEAKLASPSTDGLNAGRIARATYDFAVSGGAQGTIGLGVTLPDNALVRRAWYEVNTTLTSATDAATVAINIPTDGDLVDAIAISDVSNPWDAGVQDIVNAANVAEDYDAPTGYLKLTDARELSLVIAVEDLTAGKITIFVDYVVGA